MWREVLLARSRSLSNGSSQLAWLEADLAAVDRALTPWLVVASHRQIYLGTYKDTHVLAAFEPVFLRHRVDLVLMAHDHLYARMCAKRDGVCASDGDAPVYIVDGTTGAYSPGRNNENNWGTSCKQPQPPFPNGSNYLAKDCMWGVEHARGECDDARVGAHALVDSRGFGPPRIAETCSGVLSSVHVLSRLIHLLPCDKPLLQLSHTAILYPSILGTHGVLPGIVRGSKNMSFAVSVF